MRTPRNDQLSPTDRAKGRGNHVPERRCVVTGEVFPAERLVRLALGPDGGIAPDVHGKAPGRGAWIGVDRATLEAAQARGKLRSGLARALHESGFAIPDDLGARSHFFWTSGELFRQALDRWPAIRDGWHASGPGRTRQAIAATVAPERTGVWLDRESWERDICL